MALLTVRDVTLRFGGIVALDGVSLDVQQGTISGLIGPNGAGKTTAFNVITRLYTPDAGTVELDGATLLDVPPHGVVGRGVARTFQNINLFASMSVLENVLVGAHSRGRGVRESDALRGARLRRPRRSRRPAGLVAALRHAEARRDRQGARSLDRGCSCSTSPPAGSTTARSRSSETSSCASVTITGSPCSWSSTTWAS